MTVPVNTSNYLSLQRHTYPDPFLDFSSTVLPKSYHKMLELCRVFSMTHAQIAPVVRKIAQYPLTHIVIQQIGKEELGPLKTWWEETLDDKIDAIGVAEGAGIDLISYGDSYVVSCRPFERYYTCNGCKVTQPASSQKLKYSISNGNFTGKCPECKGFHTFEARDEPLSTEEGLAFVRIPPQDMQVKRNPANNKRRYECSPPAALKRAVKDGPLDRQLIDETPLIYVQAAMKGVKVKFAPGAVLHMTEPAPSGSDFDQGMPRILPALRTAYIDQLYRKADESGALERVLPARFVYPMPTSDNPLQTIGLGKFTRFISASLRQWRLDKNAIMTSPFPIGVAEIGNDGHQYNTVNLRAAAIKEIIGALGVPEGFLSDGMTWSGGSIQLRMLENSLNSYVRSLKRLFAFMVREISSVTGKPPVRAMLKPFRMVDDAAQLNMLLQLATAGEYPYEELLDRLDLNSDNRYETLHKELKRRQTLQVEAQLLESRASLRALQIQGAAQGRAEGLAGISEEANQLAGATYGHITRQQPFDETMQQKMQLDQQKIEHAKSLEQLQFGVQQSQLQSQQLSAEATSLALEESKARTEKLRGEAYKAKEHGDVYDAAQQQQSEKQNVQLVEAYVAQLLRLDTQGQLELLQDAEKYGVEFAKYVANEALRRLRYGVPSPDIVKNQEISQLVKGLRESSSSPDALANKIQMLEPSKRFAAVEYLVQTDESIGRRVLQIVAGGGMPPRRSPDIAVSAARPLNPVMPPR